MKILVQKEDFDLDAEVRELRKNSSVGAVVTFLGTVRDLNDGKDVSGMTLEYYPGMTEKALTKIAKQALERWDIEDVTVIHRVGELRVTDQIVLVGISGKHRGEAFDACEFVIDYLKTEAPFWKKETLPEGERWVEARDSDETAKERWN
ncbi:molybdopterin synthase catalytic subunit MoaE [uncultured Parasutterella sp.]|jgi:Molybdopterin converting factor, large subunit|uniref:molybdopterin synthase catalytic subunit MoaE n=1 Tax=uncultured Parasutterella sp. TaxID=1263098 RepID=UPI002593941E|nr:molybdopterin synthase catalytic subunit MoaE [uncultured Parasutterella sp.]